MTEAVTKQRPSTDFEEFERFMRESAEPRHQGPQPGDSDPLSELARIVGHHPDPYHDVFAHEARGATDAVHHTPSLTEPLPDRPAIDFAAIEAGLRGTIAAHPIDRHDGYGGSAEDGYGASAENYQAQPRFQDQSDPSRTPAPRSRGPIYTMAAVIVAGVVGVGVAFAYKGVNSGPREIAMIKPTPGPTKVQPTVDETREPAHDASILDKAQQPAPTRTVSREEQPVDLAQSVQNAPRNVDTGITPLYNFGFPGASADAASVPVPTPPGQADQQKPADVAADIKPIRVKTRSYRPDGTPIPNDQSPVAAADAAPPVAPKAEKVVVAKPSSPKVVVAKSTTRVAPKSIVTASLGEDAPTDLAPVAPHKVKVKPVKPVKTVDVPSQADPAGPAADNPADEAAASQAPATSSGSGGFAVQLAAPGSEAEAKQASSRLSQKYAGELSGHDLSFQKALSKGKQVYRVRVGGLSRDEATSMCDKLKSSGGSCFVAKN